MTDGFPFLPLKAAMPTDIIMQNTDIPIVYPHLELTNLLPIWIKSMSAQKTAISVYMISVIVIGNKIKKQS